jgi:hypothetical protein
LRNATARASSSALSTVECGAFGPIGASWTKAHFLYFVTVFGLRS